jgi:predicted TIM-barrel fold metal-dependent hydrolase
MADYPTNFINEIKSAAIYHRFLNFLDRYRLNQIIDCHAHISSGRSDFIPDASLEDIKELPQNAFSVNDLNDFYHQLFQVEGIEVKLVVFDTPLHGYDLSRKNQELLKNPRKSNFFPFAIITPEMSREEIEQYVVLGAKGFKVSPRTTSSYWAAGKKSLSNVALSDMLNQAMLKVANRFRLPIVIHLPQSVRSPRLSPQIKDGLSQAISVYPEVRFVLAHLGLSQAPNKLIDTLNWLERIEDKVYLDISAVTVPQAIKMALESSAKLCFGTDLDFCLAERARYFLIDDDTATLVSNSFGGEYRQKFADGEFSQPLFLYQLEAIMEAVEIHFSEQNWLRGKLHQLFYQNAAELLGLSRGIE